MFLVCVFFKGLTKDPLLFIPCGYIFELSFVHVLLTDLIGKLCLFVVQFSRSVAPPPLSGDLLIISHSFSFVNTFLKVFSNFFLDLSARSSLDSLAQSACILYIFFLLLSIPFLKFFQVFLDFFAFFKTSCFLRKIVYNRY